MKLYEVELRLLGAGFVSCHAAGRIVEFREEDLWAWERDTLRAAMAGASRRAAIVTPLVLRRFVEASRVMPRDDGRVPN